jgi:hypothetical protein
MADKPPPQSSDVAGVAAELPLRPSQTDGFSVKDAVYESTEQAVDRIEMIGEEMAAGYRPPAHSEVTPGMRYLHCSRTIHQLVADRNRAVGLYLAVATLLWTASTALLNANPPGDLILPIDLLKRWCLPFTFGIMTVLAVFVGLLLVRTRVGLIYEVAKMNVLLGLPVGRVSRISPFSIFFLLQTLVSMAGGCSAGLLAAYLLRLGGTELGHLAVPSTLVGIAFALVLMLIYVFRVLYVTSETKLQGLGK